MSFPAYPTYKDSGGEWIGAIPDHWLVSPLKRAFKIEGGSTPTPDEVNWDGDIAWVTPADLSGLSSLFLDGSKRTITATGLASCGTTLLPAGSLILSTRAPIGSLAIALISMCTNQGCKGLVPNANASAVYFAFVLLTAKDELNNRGRGSTFLEISGDELSRFSVPTPPFAEQTQIARFLDHETARIDALIEEQQRLIELLKEKRQAVISHAVTKGLDPTVPMKDSGVDWLGEVPAHWKQIRIKHILNAMIDAEHKTAEYSDDGEYLVCRTTNVRNGLLSLEGAKYADRNTYIDWTRRGVPEPLDILFTREAPAGEACLVPENLEICLGQRMVLFKLEKTRIDPAFTVHSIYAGLASDFVKQLSQGSTVSHFNMADIGNIPLFEPPLPEQREISDFLAKRCDSYDLLINEAESSVKLISERRSALISAAVTGKIDVRGWQPPANAPIPELVQEAV